ncbi:MAG TPA: VanW family protein, partial [Polyangiaceae bacterium]
MRVWTAFVGGAVLAAAAFGAYPEVCAWRERELFILVGEQVPPVRGELGAWLARRSQAVNARRATLLSDSGAVDLSFEQLGLHMDVVGSLRLAQQAAPVSSWLGRLRQQFAAKQNLPDVPLVFRFDAQRASLRLGAFAASVYRPAVDARLDLAAHQRVVDLPGRELDLAASLVAIAEGGRDDGAVFEVITRAIPARVTEDMLRAVDVGRVLSSYETDFTHHAGPRAINITTAARYLNGTVIAPGEVFSFNKTVGPRTVPRGFTFAPVIVADELEPGVGGGVCQVASTLHAAAVFGGFEVVQRRNHSRPSGYTPLGLDATVVDGELDLKLKNPYDSPLIVHAFLPTHGSLRIELLGREPPGKVE